MLLEYLSYPSRDEWRKIVNEIDLNSKLSIEIEFPDPEDIFDLFDNQEQKDWLRLFNNRLGEVRQTYIFLTHYFNMGIPDDNWNKSPGDNGESIQYFPDFEEKHHYIKHMYDYYSDIFFFKFFSAWETLFHFYNVYFEFRLPQKLGFKYQVLKELEKINSELYESIKSVHDSEAFEKFTKLRNDITHNYSPSEITPGIYHYDNGMTAFGVGKYTTTRDIQNNIIQIIDITGDFLEKMKNIIVSGFKKS
ncbi:Cthe_2314 family HEPN domain-containing protein [Paenibacillus sp. 7523-1]|uniref:Cthe_2314 family HEPN domain-containing protein n=1 Tax=Paenibacillus sp. 7523-1 TaxID=2022550 RepID=UPI000BA5B795|nr:Cthe_2314 family HEPN domain-containing protein [Paenibacillus sp. 7523-1]PAD30041.1 hypothetical protein CHH60_18075 [Paenibacillus sp. 7523-1]